jgi:hypothetical protein
MKCALPSQQKPHFHKTNHIGDAYLVIRQYYRRPCISLYNAIICLNWESAKIAKNMNILQNPRVIDNFFFLWLRQYNNPKRLSWQRIFQVWMRNKAAIRLARSDPEKTGPEIKVTLRTENISFILHACFAEIRIWCASNGSRAVNY